MSRFRVYNNIHHLIYSIYFAQPPLLLLNTVDTTGTNNMAHIVIGLTYTDWTPQGPVMRIVNQGLHILFK